MILQGSALKVLFPPKQSDAQWEVRSRELFATAGRWVGGWAGLGWLGWDG